MFLESADPVRLAATREALRRAYVIRTELHDDQAVQIIQRLGEALRE